MIKAILFFSWSVKSMSSKSGIEVISSLVISISKKLVLSTIGGGIVVVVVSSTDVSSLVPPQATIKKSKKSIENDMVY